MALSGSVDFNMTAQQLIENAYSKIGVKKLEQPLIAAEIQDGLDVLNMMVKTFQAQGLHLWSMVEGVAFLDVGIASYKLGPTGANACALDDFVPTELSADVNSGDTVLTLDDTTGMLAGDYIGIEISNNVRQWALIDSVDSLTQVTIDTPLTGDASSGNSVFTYTTKIDRPMRILSFRRNIFGTDDELEMYAWPRNKYFNQTNKNSQGTPINAYYSPQLTDGIVYIWQTASSVNQLLRFTYEKPLDDIDLETNNLPFPVEWLEPISDNLAARLGVIYQGQIPANTLSMIQQIADRSLKNILEWDEEMESLNMYPTGYN